MVVTLDEAIELRLLLQKVPRCRLRGLFLQRQVHALVSAVLFGMTRSNAFNEYPQPQPPHGKLAQAAKRVASCPGEASSEYYRPEQIGELFRAIDGFSGTFPVVCALRWHLTCLSGRASTLCHCRSR